QILILAIGLLTLALSPTVLAQSPTPTPSNQPSTQNQSSGGEAGGPTGDIGPIAIPKKKTEQPPPREVATPTPQKIEGMGNFSMHVSAQLVNVDVGVLTKDGMFVPGLKKENFRVLEDGVPQTVTMFNQTQAPITAVMLVEFASNFYAMEYDAVMG